MEKHTTSSSTSFVGKGMIVSVIVFWTLICFDLWKQFLKLQAACPCLFWSAFDFCCSVARYLMHLLARHERDQTLPIQQPMSLTKVVRVDRAPGTKCWILQLDLPNYQVHGPSPKVLVVGFDPPIWSLGTSSACLMHTFMRMSFLVQDQNCSMFPHGWYVLYFFVEIVVLLFHMFQEQTLICFSCFHIWSSMCFV